MPPNDPNQTNSAGGTVGNTQTNYNSGSAGTGARGVTGNDGSKAVTGSSGKTTSGFGGNTTSANKGSTAGAQKSSTGPRGPTGPGGAPKSPSQVSPGTGIKGTGPRGPLGPGGQASTPSQIKPPAPVAAPGKTNLGGGPTTTTVPSADPRRRQTAFANPTTPIQGNVLRQQVGTPTQQALAEEARKRRNIGPNNPIGNIVAGTDVRRTPVGPAAPGQQVSDLTGIGAIDGVRPGFPTLQPSQPKIAGRVPTETPVASYDPLGSVRAPSAAVPSTPGAVASVPTGPRGLPGAQPSDLTRAPAATRGLTPPTGPRGLPGAQPSNLVGGPQTPAPGKGDLPPGVQQQKLLGGSPYADAWLNDYYDNTVTGQVLRSAIDNTLGEPAPAAPPVDPRRNQSPFQNPTTPIQGRVLMQQVGTPAQKAIADAAIARRASELGPAVADPRRGQATFANPTTPIQGNVLRQQVGTPTQQALANEALQRRQVASGPRGLPGLQPSDLKQNVSYPDYQPAERVTAIEPYQNDPALRSMPPNPTGARGLPGLQPSDLAAAPTALAENEGAAPNPANNVDLRMQNYQLARMPQDPTDETGAADYIAPGPLDSDPDVMNAPDEGTFDPGDPGTVDQDLYSGGANIPDIDQSGAGGGYTASGDGGDSPILYDEAGNPVPSSPSEGGGTDGGTDGGGTPPAPPVPGVENLMPWDVATYMELRSIYAASGIDYTPEQFMDEYYDTRALANPSIDLPDRPSPATTELAMQYAAQEPTVNINPADELIAA